MAKKLKVNWSIVAEISDQFSNVISAYDGIEREMLIVFAGGLIEIFRLNNLPKEDLDHLINELWKEYLDETSQLN